MTRQVFSVEDIVLGGSLLFRPDYLSKTKKSAAYFPEGDIPNDVLVKIWHYGGSVSAIMYYYIDRSRIAGGLETGNAINSFEELRDIFGSAPNVLVASKDFNIVALVDGSDGIALGIENTLADSWRIRFADIRHQFVQYLRSSADLLDQGHGSRQMFEVYMRAYGWVQICGLLADPN